LGLIVNSCCCPCGNCVCCEPDRVQTGTGTGPEDQSGTGTGGQILIECPPEELVRVPCCTDCLPCELCLSVVTDTCAGPDPTCAGTGTGGFVYLTFDRCYVDERTNEDVFQWTNTEGVLVCDPAGFLSLRPWTFFKLYFQCRQHRDTGVVRFFLESPDQTYCDYGCGVLGYAVERIDQTWTLVSSTCAPLRVEFQTELIGVPFPPTDCGPCAGCFVNVVVQACGPDLACDCGLLRNDYPTLTATVINLNGCSCLSGSFTLFDGGFGSPTCMWERELEVTTCPGAPLPDRAVWRFEFRFYELRSGCSKMTMRIMAAGGGTQCYDMFPEVSAEPGCSCPPPYARFLMTNEGFRTGLPTPYCCESAAADLEVIVTA